MSKVFYPFSKGTESEPTKKNDDLQIEENFLNLWSYLRRRYPKINLEKKDFIELIKIKTSLEGPHQLREWNEDIASVRKH